MSRKIAVVVVHGVACLFVRLQVLVVVYAANLLQLIGHRLPAGPPQLFVLAVYDAARFPPTVVFLLKNVATNHCM